ncbi:MAG: hypothetical protein B6D39_08010 [Anaerolineae bacterium UTCFX2]|jgi:multiple sugar transport system permease protein|nr:MAG: hypothetical protein B6D39_08010 [Anaerolineae bacterium UTCFX2]
MVHVPRLRLAARLRDGSTLFILGGYLISILYAIIILVPIYYVAISAFKTNRTIFTQPLALPETFTFDNFVRAQKVAVLDRAFLISTGVTVGAEILTLLLAFPAAYAIARIPTRLSSLFEYVFSLGFLIPALAMLVPVYLLVVRIGLLYSPMALVIFYPATKISVSVILLASYLRTVPKELEESAQMDGASRLQMIRHIFFPIARPGVITVLILNFIDFWNEFLFALVMLNQRNRTLQIALTVIKTDRSLDYGLVAAGIVIVVVPVCILFILFQEQIVRGMYTGAVKG